jgi:hypothetical protein
MECRHETGQTFDPLRQEGGGNVRTSDLVKVSGIAVSLLAVGAAALPFVSVPAMGQAAGMAGLGESDTISLRATVTAIDQASRIVTLTGPAGNSLTMQVGEQVRNLGQVKVGDKVIVRYHGSIAYVLAPPGTKLPDNSVTGAVVGAAPGQSPAGVAAAKLVVTGLVVGVDPTAYTVQLVNPSGGQIRQVSVVTPEGRQAMKSIKVGDTITAIVSEAMAISVEPAT